MSGVLSRLEAASLVSAIGDRLPVVSFGAGVDSTAMLIALRSAGIRPRLVLFADTGAERRATLRHVDRMSDVLRDWGWPAIDVCRHVPLASTGYDSLPGNLWVNSTLPSIAFGRSSCSLKWKVQAMHRFLAGVSRGPNRAPPHKVWLEAQSSGRRIVKLIGYDAGGQDLRRAGSVAPTDEHYDYVYPLQVLGWTRDHCERAIAQALGSEFVPVKSACFMCTATKPYELFWLAAYEPDLLDTALRLEHRAMSGRHSRFDALRMGGTWDALVRQPGGLSGANCVVGLGRTWAWTQWALVNDVLDATGRVRTALSDQRRFAAAAEALRPSASRRGRVIPIKAALAGSLESDGPDSAAAALHLHVSEYSHARA